MANSNRTRRGLVLAAAAGSVAAIVLTVVANAQVAEPATSKQSIRLEATPDGRMRLNLEGPETWTIEAKTFEVRSRPEGVLLVAQPLTVQIQTPRTKSIANEFELLVKADGSLGFTIRDSRQIK